MGEAHKDGHKALLNPGEENEMDIFGYKTHICRKVLCIIGYIFSLGFLWLLFYWKPEWHVWANCVPCSLEEASVVLLRTTDDFKQTSWKKVKWIQLSSKDFKTYRAATKDPDSTINKAIIMPELKVRYVQVQKIRYIWDNIEKQFTKAGILEDHYSCSSIHAMFESGVALEEEGIRRLICGPNIIDVGIIPIWKLLVKEVLNPFYVFQLFSVCLWFAEEYIEYSVAIILMSLICIFLSVYTLRQQSVKLHKLVESHNNITVSVYGEDRGIFDLESRHLAPGDILVIKRNTLLPCDALLFKGGCIVNESMLTGESIPVTKTPLPNTDNTEPWKVHSVHDYKRHVLFCGTQVIQVKASYNSPVKAVVLRTGFNTAKGDLVRSILYPKPVNYRLYRDAVIFLCTLIGTAFIGMIYAVCVFSLSGSAPGEVVLKALDVITIAVPPALPAALTAGIMYAQRRLEKAGIFCISPQRINLCGMINLFCFDKTGTLTEDGLDLWGVVPANGYRFQNVIILSPDSSLPWGPLFGAMATCHSLIVLDGNVQGDPLDQKMFESTCWVLEDQQEDNMTENMPQRIVKPGPTTSSDVIEGIVILQQFPFSSSLQRMSVITQVLNGDEYAVYLKGAPEMVASFCKTDTVPINFPDELAFYTKQGFRVIGLAYKILDIKDHKKLLTLKREEVESDLIFLGLLVLENRLKLETRPVLKELNRAKVRSVMITGDNLQTAITVARSCGIVQRHGRVILAEASEPNGSIPASITWKEVETNLHVVHDNTETTDPEKNSDAQKSCPYYFAMSGKTYGIIVQYFYSLLPKLLLNGAIFARMSPGQKANLIEEFQKLDYYVAMCGDGANDCGALKMAHAGISLSEQEASVASPFTSQTANILCVPQLIKEGRAALVSSFAVFKYVTLYSMIQFICMLLLYWKLKMVGLYQYLFQDVGITILVSLTLSLTHPYQKLAPYRPPAQLISPPLLLSIIFNILLSLASQICGFLLVQQQPWYSTSNYRACAPTTENITAVGFNISNTNSTGVEENPEFENYESTTLWPITTINLIIVAFVFSKGTPFRKPIYTNYLFFCLLPIQLAACLFILFADLKGLYRAFQLICTPTIWRISILIIVLIYFLVSFAVEELFIENRRVWLYLKKICKYYSNSKYRVLYRMVQNDSRWPPVDTKQNADNTESNLEGYANACFIKDENEIKE
uniref:Cation-transporting ATPase n=1 Tax=Xenopus tropicalis TaxID=8364 RepID=A0A803JFT6_XENTR